MVNGQGSMNFPYPASCLKGAWREQVRQCLAFAALCLFVLSRGSGIVHTPWMINVWGTSKKKIEYTIIIYLSNLGGIAMVVLRWSVFCKKIKICTIRAPVFGTNSAISNCQT